MSAPRVGVVIVVASALACSPFGEAAPIDKADGGTDASADVGTAADGDADAAVADGDCFDLTKAANQVTWLMHDVGTPSHDAPNGLKIDFASCADCPVAFRRTFTVADSASRARLLVQGTITLPSSPALPMNEWYADIVRLVRGPVGSAGSSPGVFVTLSKDNSPTHASVDANLFPNGTDNDQSSSHIGEVPAAPNPTFFSLVVEVHWTATPDVSNVKIMFDGPATIPLEKPLPTTSAAPLQTTEWSVELGGKANKAPATSTTFTKVCLAASP